jgi:dGTPase
VPKSPPPNCTTRAADEQWRLTLYTSRDAERRLPEVHSTNRGHFARDRARLLHSSALRRLAAKTQVLSPTTGVDFARNRLTHSLEVAQVGRELATALGLDPDVVDTACLAHDLGHPPFGHNGEGALAEWASDIGGFEGNAQTLRLLTRIEPKVMGPDGATYGLNLTRASLDASCKYPWPREDGIDDPSGRSKFGVYDDDRPAFEWMREGAPVGVASIEAQVMDLSDDIAYSVHDFEDAIVGGLMDAALIASRGEHDALLAGVQQWSGDAVTLDELEAAFERLAAIDTWVSNWSGSRRDLAGLKNLTSRLIGRFAHEAVHATRAAHPSVSLARFGGTVIVPRETRAEIAVLKGIVGTLVMSTNARQPLYARQRTLLVELADALWQAGPGALDRPFADDFAAAADDAARRRVIVDQVASLTDQGAMIWHERLIA